MRASRLLLGLLAMAAGPLLAASPDRGIDDPGPDTAVLRVEIPAGSAVKYEFDSQGRLFVDRFLPGSEVYSANYGGLPGTLAGDGDPLDALVITRQPLLPGVRIAFRPIGVLRMRDGGQHDDKLIGVPISAVDADYDMIQELEQLPPALRQRIEGFFSRYKHTRAEGNPVQLAGWGDAGQARELLRQALARGAARP